MRAVAAEALAPVASFLGVCGSEGVQRVQTLLWDILLDLEDLSPSTGKQACRNLLFSKSAPPPPSPSHIFEFSSLCEGRFNQGKQPATCVSELISILDRLMSFG